MKRLLFLINYIPVCMFFMTCNSTPANTGTNPDDNVSPGNTVIITDSIMKDTSIIYPGPVFDEDTIVIKRVEHGSNEQEKLDSIKNAKAKRKRPDKPLK